MQDLAGAMAEDRLSVSLQERRGGRIVVLYPDILIDNEDQGGKCVEHHPEDICLIGIIHNHFITFSCDCRLPDLRVCAPSRGL